MEESTRCQVGTTSRLITAWKGQWSIDSNLQFTERPSPQPLFLRVPGHGDARQQVVCWSGPQGKGMHWLSLAAW